MKKVLLLIMCIVVFSSDVFCQNNKTQSHLLFMGISMGEKTTLFSEKLIKNKGFVLIKKQQNGCLLKGVFGGEKCELIIGSTSKSGITYCVLVTFQTKQNESILWSNYNELKSQLIKKYSTPNSENETSSLFKTENGDIILSFDEDHIEIGYFDKINTIVKEKEATQRISNDI